MVLIRKMDNHIFCCTIIECVDIKNGRCTNYGKASESALCAKSNRTLTYRKCAYALFNYLFARHLDGKFIIRIEDTDVKRNVAGGEESQLKYLKWLGMDWDEGVDVGGEFDHIVKQSV